MKRRNHYWLTGKGEDGKPFLIDRGSAEDEARQKGFETLGGLNFEVKMFPTSDMARASSMFKGNRLNTERNLKNAMQRVRHKHPRCRKRNRSSL